MVLVDTSVWIDHLRTGDAHLTRLLEQGMVVGHPCVAVELSLGRIRNRAVVLELIRNLPSVPVATPDELFHFIEARELGGGGVGYVDASLLASAVLDGAVCLWTRDRALHGAAEALGVAYAA